MPNKMLIDASHPEETRVVVVRGSRIEEFDFESQDKKQLKGNIYLARVTRVEPSLQAAFVEYGGNRHGFLAFSEIHPDYYQIPVADRQALLRAEAAEAEEEDDEDGDGDEGRGRGNRKRRRGSKSRDRNADQPRRAAETSEGSGSSDAGESEREDRDDDSSDELVAVESFETVDGVHPDRLPKAEHDENATESSQDDDEPKGDGPAMAAAIDGDVVSEPVVEAAPDDNDRGLLEEVPASNHDDHEIESVGAEDALEEVRNRRKPPRRHYKIQEVIKRRQILLVQVVKEERGNKGAALTTYLSLAGRYSVLMPNTARGGGISRKITNTQDRKRLKEVVSDLEVPQGMGVILRTAGESRTKAEIKRDYEYLMRLWENVRNLTLQSTAPALVYEEGSLIKRSVRDLYNKDIDEVLVSGEEGYREAKDFMRMLMPSHAKVVQPYRDTTPIFVRSGIEAQLDRMVQPQVTLKSGGYIIINQTEALVAIDVNSGRSTKEHSIEETALHTNLEAAEEVARQLRLRDLAGLIVIDFIDMEENRNNRAVEKRLKDHLKNDRARIQVGRISHFGLMEMSRQRIRASVLESTMKPCPHCGGTGHVRSESSVALLVVRAIEEFLLKDSRSHITVRTPTSTALYVLNHKRSTLSELEHRFGLTITIEMDDAVGSQHYAITRGAIAEKPVGFTEALTTPAYVEIDEPEDEIVEDEAVEAKAEAAPANIAPKRPPEGGEDGQRDRKRRRRRRRRGGRDRDGAVGENGSPMEAGDDDHADDASDEAEDRNEDVTARETIEGEIAAAPAAVDAAAEQTDAEDGQAKKRRRGKRGGKRNRADEGDAPSASVEASGDDEAVTEPVAADAEAETVAVAAEETPAEAPADVAVPAEKPKRVRRTAKSKKAAEAAEVTSETVGETAVEPASEPVGEAAPKPVMAAEPVSEPVAEPVVAAEDTAPAAERPARRKAAPRTLPEAPVEPVVSSTTAAEEKAEEQPKKGGWWQRRSFF